ncbi:MAG: hypothetical protein ACP5NI_06150 [Acetobacteraceae bacterium]
MAERPPRLSMWTYPWDVLALGAGVVAGELTRRAGLNTISLAAAYHAGRFLQPRGPLRHSYFPEDGTVYFRPDPRRWEGLALTPRLASLVEERGDALAQMIALREAGGLAVACWTVLLHNMRLGLAHPEAVVRNALGDALPFALCPSNEAVRAYARTLLADLTHRYRPDAVELETPGFMGWAHGYHHEKDGVGLTAEDDFLLSLCFCPSCLARSGRAGVDGRAAGRAARTLLAAALARAVPAPLWPDFHARGPAAFAAHPALMEYVLWRVEPVTSLVAEIRAETHPGTRVHVIEGGEGWRLGADLPALAAAADGILLCVYDRSAEAVGQAVAEARAAVGPERFLGAGLRVFHPEMADAAALARHARAALAAGAEGINFYNYGLIPAARLDWVGQAASALR